jgi:hypothetical protein
MRKKQVDCESQSCTKLNSEACQTCHHNINSAYYVNCETENKCVRLHTPYCRQDCHHNKSRQT